MLVYCIKQHSNYYLTNFMLALSLDMKGTYSIVFSSVVAKVTGGLRTGDYILYIPWFGGFLFH